MQRVFDIIFSGIAILILLPFAIPLIIILRLTGEGKIFFVQNRVGYGGKYFKLYKFATMLQDSPNLGTGTITIKNDPRILFVGRFLRKTKINELPQLLNVFKGEMSVIGPRPLTRRCFDVIPLILQKQIIKVRPGLSGIASIVFRNEEWMLQLNKDPEKFYDQIIMPYKGSLESWYVSNQTLIIYFNLIALTIWVVLCPNSSLVWKIFRGLPEPVNELKQMINNRN